MIKISGVFGSSPIHFKIGDDKEKITEESLYIDVFCSTKEEVLNKGIEIGNYIVFDRKPEIIDNKYIISKSLDDKIGGFIITEVLNKLVSDKIDLPYDLYAVNSTQEEVGLRGSKMITDTIKPNIAICFDVSFDTSTPNTNKDKHGDYKMGDGLIFRVGSDVHPTFLKHMKKVADDKNYKYKIYVGGAGGTNTNSYNLSNGGVVTSTISIPLRYMHTPNEIVSLDDIQTTIDYIVDLLKSINGNQFNLLD